MNLNKQDKQIKNSTVFTPKKLSKYIHNIVNKEYESKIVYDPCIGVSGGMTNIFRENGSFIYGSDIDKKSEEVCDIFFHQDIKELDLPDFKPDLIVMNPPFNGNGRGKNLLFPHLFLKTIFDKFGEDQKVIMITGDNFLNNNSINSKRLEYISNGKFDITSIMTLPLDIFENIRFNTQVLFFNMPKLKPYYIFDMKKAISNNYLELKQKAA